MHVDRVMRGALRAAALVNLLGVVVFGLAAVGRPSTLLPLAVPPFYAAQLALVIAIFGGAYAWLARQPRIDVPLVVVGAMGKAGFFGLALVYWALGDLPVRAMSSAMPDLVLALVFCWWLHSPPTLRGVSTA